MADSLRRIVDMESFSVLQDKLDNWSDDYHLNSSNANVDRCIEIIELNSRVQAQLFRILHFTATEGGIKSRLLPWLSNGILTPPIYPAPLDTTVTLRALSDVAAKDREILDLKDVYERSLEDLEADLHSTKDEADNLKTELQERDFELETLKRHSTTDKEFADTELHQMRNRILSLEEELGVLRSRDHLVDEYERQIRRLRDELIRVNVAPSNALLRNGDVEGLKSLPTTKRSRSPTPLGGHYDDDDDYYDERPMDQDQGKSADSNGIVQKFRQQRLVDRFSDMFIRERLDALDVLRQFSDDQENNKRTIFRSVQECFMVARLAFINFKMRIRSTLASFHTGPGTLEQAVQDYINRNPDLYNLSEMVSDVVRSVDRRSGLPDDLSCDILQSFIREVCRVAWGLAALPRPLESSAASDYELFDATKYRRSFDSDATGSLVSFHVWPCLMQGTRVISKGEVYIAKPGTISRSRSRSPVRSESPSYRSRSRSSSPRRETVPSPSPDQS